MLKAPLTFARSPSACALPRRFTSLPSSASPITSRGAYDRRRIGCGNPRRCRCLEPRDADAVRARRVCRSPPQVSSRSMRPASSCAAILQAPIAPPFCSWPETCVGAAGRICSVPSAPGWGRGACAGNELVRFLCGALPSNREIHDQAMRGISIGASCRCAAAPWTSRKRDCLIDVGGGTGELLAGILAAYPRTARRAVRSSARCRPCVGSVRKASGVGDQIADRRWQLLRQPFLPAAIPTL